MRLAYADPPYPGQSKKHYGNHPDYAGEVDHEQLLQRLEGYDGWVLHTSSTTLRDVLPLCPPDIRIMAWVKPFAAFKKGVSPAYAWEPVLVKPARANTGWRYQNGGMRDWIDAPISLQSNTHGAKPARVCYWAFDVLGAEPDDDLADLFPGSGAVAKAWEKWRGNLPHVYDTLPLPLEPIPRA